MEGLKFYLHNPKSIYTFLSTRGLLDWMPDTWYLKMAYRINIGKKLNLKTPQTFCEKIQWLKLHDRRPEYTLMVDKYEAKKYVADKIGEKYIIPTLGVWDSFDDIDFDALPNQFVLKCTHDSGGLVICTDKNRFDKMVAKRKIVKSLSREYYRIGREWPYKCVKHRIIAEQYMTDNTQLNGKNDLTDYKFYCFNGEPKFLYVSLGLQDHSTALISYLTLDWQFAPFQRDDYKNFEKLPPKPSNFDEMLLVARKLSENIPFLRVDLYEIDDAVYFSELTFSPTSGFMPFKPDMWEYIVGEWISL
ncbi:MAG: glycosyl transferase [Lachnospiraceae bacterium]|nr:glycosyl transferase [Lachnospiraceae bacterium]